MPLNDLIRKAKMFFTTVSLIQKYKIDVFETKGAEMAERFQDYGFAAQPSEGEGLVIDAGGSMVVLRVDRLSDRPSLANDDVAVWHKDGAKIHLKASRIIEVDCAAFNVKASDGVHFETPKVSTSGTVDAAVDVVSAGKSFNNHQHREHDVGGLVDPPN